MRGDFLPLALVIRFLNLLHIAGLLFVFDPVGLLVRR